MTRLTLSPLQRSVKRWELNNIFCIVSAIGNNYGKFNYKERFEQLLESIESIKTYAPGSDIVIYDASEDPLPHHDLQRLRELVNKVEVLNDDRYVKFLKYNSKDPTENKFEKKTVGEIQATLAFLEFLKNHPKKYNRVFKLTGRYKLNQNFNLRDYDDKNGKCVFLNKEDWFGKFIYRIRLWSFDYEDLFQISSLFKEIQSLTYETVTKTGELLVVEYAITKVFDERNVDIKIVNQIGVCGLGGLSGKYLEEWWQIPWGLFL